jgi:hypothetical protein
MGNGDHAAILALLTSSLLQNLLHVLSVVLRFQTAHSIFGTSHVTDTLCSVVFHILLLW